MKHHAGDLVWVDFCGREHRGEVVRESNGWVMCRILVDAIWDYGSITARLDPESTVCVPSSRVRHADPTCTK